MRKVKIITTIGPSSGKYEVLSRLIQEGVDGFRINFSHGNPHEWDEWVKMVRELAEKYEREISIMGDLPGPQVRIGELPVQEIKAKQTVKLVYKDKVDEENTIPVPNRKVFEILELGDIVLIDDGKIILRIIDIGGNEAEAIVLNDAVLYPHKTLVVFGKEIDLPVLSEKDVDLVNYSVSRKLTYLAISFVRRSSDIVIVRDIVSRLNGEIGLIAKIETRSAVKNLKDIMSVSDAIIIARGDLGMHYSLEELPGLQRKIAREAIMIGKPSIVATQLLESMVNYPRPSRSEVVDVVNAVYDLVDALLLTDETAIGKYPVESVKWLKRIISSAESSIVERRIEDIREKLELRALREKYALGLTLLAEKINAKILIYTKTSTIPPAISRFRPQIPVYVGTSDKLIAEKLTIYYGLKPFYLKQLRNKDIDYDQGVKTLYEHLKNKEEITYGEIIAEAYGRRETQIHEIKIRQVI
ncbi:pyruvate kinase [Staphylothermus marinus F1]|uniref:Pyruvate kinase n=1 Tax=Staphylothermus marinus (strain ATCC 43588 / DSM 3639 / JCM 9404 / F1) TaxID=399550 RepID=A3DMY9_STAMF|nr:pyruvate kinase [Staphylothermus marinus]ABN69999.1 pyruvate kinase [Staphylothermus marinus F1]